MKNHAALVEYEEILLGKRRVFSKIYVGNNTPEREIIPVFKYAFSLLGWSVRDIRDFTTLDILKALKLYRLYIHLKKPGEIDPEKDIFYLAYKIYPEVLGYSKRDTVLNTYEKVMNGLRSKLPKNFFEGSEGELNATICMQHQLSKANFSDSEEMYKFFSDKKKGEAFLKKNKLDIFYKNVYGHPIDFLHESLPDEQKNEFYYYYYKFLINQEN